MTQHPSGDNSLDDNPFAAPSALPYQLPPFGQIRDEHYRPAFDAGMREQLAEVEVIATDPEPATFANTIEALERSGALLTRTVQVFFNLTSSNVTDSLSAIEAEVAPLLSAHEDTIRLDQRLFARVADLHARRNELGLDGEQLRLLERYHLDLVRAGAGLDEASREALRTVNSELSSLATTFKNHLLADTNDLAVHVIDVAELEGMSSGAVAAARQAATDRGLDGYLVTLVLPTGQPTLEVLRHRPLRQRIHRASVCRGLRGNEFDTRTTLTRIVELRARRARLLGYPDHASYVVADQTAGTLAAVDAMLAQLVGPAVANAKVEAAELETMLVADGQAAPLQPWDWAYYADAVRRERYHVDTAALRPYFELQRVVTDGIFYAATELYGLTFERRTDLVGYHPEVEVYEVNDDQGRAHGLFLADWYARDSKRGGAWMSSFVDQSHLLGTRPVVVINLNIPRPPAEQPTLLTLDELRTAFHEFGHVLHGLLSDVTHPRLSGTSVPRDFVEFPSQVNEMWAMWPQVLQRYAVPPPETVSRWTPRSPTDCGRRTVRRGVRDHRVPGRHPARPGVAPPRPGRRTGGTGRRRDLRGGRAAARRARPSTWCRRATAAATSPTSSPAATAPGTTATSGARFSTPTPSSGSASTAG